MADIPQRIWLAINPETDELELQRYATNFRIHPPHRRGQGGAAEDYGAHHQRRGAWTPIHGDSEWALLERLAGMEE